MSGMNSSISIEFNKREPVGSEVYSVTSNTLKFYTFSDDALSAMFLYITATPEQFRQISEKCWKFANELDLNKVQAEQTEERQAKNTQEVAA